MSKTIPTRIFLAGSFLVLLAAMWAGLVRLGWPWPALQPFLPSVHGPLMAAGFLGTLISLERAVAVGKPWAYASPVFHGLGALALAVGLPLLAGQILLLLGSLGMLVILITFLQRQPAAHTLLLALGGASLLAGNALWLSAQPVPLVFLWWAGFLVLTIAGERLELGRVRRLPRRAEAGFLVLACGFLISLLIAQVSQNLGARLAGLAMLCMAAWLLSFDISRFTVRKPGMPRFAAISLLSGYAWLGIAGIFAITWGNPIAGLRYDALLHSLFLGFVMAMIFGHAPIILPALSAEAARPGLSIAYRPSLYAPLVLLHLSLAVRVAGDLLGYLSIRMWGGLFNVIAILLFLGMLAANFFSARAR